MIRICPFKEKEKERGERRSQFSGQCKVLMFSGPWNVPMLNGQWKVPILGGQWKEKEKEKEKHFFTFSHFPPTNFT